MAGYIGPIPVPQATQSRETFTATASQTSFGTAGYQVGYLDVFMNGVKLAPADFTATNGSDVVLASGAAVNDIIEVVSYSAFEVLNQNFTGTTTVVDLTVTGDLTVDGTTTTINSTTLNVDDINITVASGAADAAAANGAGLTVDGANATFNYASSGDKWTMNKDLDVSGVALADELNLSGGGDVHSTVDTGYVGVAGGTNSNVGANFLLYGGTHAAQANNIVIRQGSTERARFNTAEFVINDAGNDYNFRVESDNQQYMIFVDGGNDRVNIGTSAGGGRLSVHSGSYPQTDEILTEFQGGFTSGTHDRTRYVKLKQSFTGSSYESPALVFESNANASNQKGYGVIHTKAGGALAFANKSAGTAVAAGTGIGATERFQLGTSAAVFNEPGNDYDFRVESDGATHALFVDAGNNGVGIFNSADTSLANLSVGLTGVAIAGDTDGATIGKGGIVRLVNNNNFSTTDATVMLLSGGTGGSVGQISSGFGFARHSNSTWGTQIKMYVHPNDTADLDELHEAARVGPEEFVINETSNNYDFRVESNNNTHALFVDAGTGDLKIGHNNSVNPHQMTSGNAMTFRSDIGLFSLARETYENIILNRTGSTNGDVAVFRRNATPVGSISVTSSGTTYNTTSDRRLKDNIEPIANGTEKLMAMNPVSHKWKADPEADAVVGFIAQEMQEIVPEAVSGDPDGEEMMSMDYGRITPILVAALQEATNEIKALKERVAELEAK